VTHCLLLETSAGLVLVDSGYSLQDYTHPSRRVRWFMRLNGTRIQPELAASQQLARLGCQPSDVRHILLTHLHLDHACGIRDFPVAQVHVWEVEYAAAQRPRRFNPIDMIGYIPEVRQLLGRMNLPLTLQSRPPSSNGTGAGRFRQRRSFPPARADFNRHWCLHHLTGETWFGLPAMPVLATADCELLLVPLAGHSPGHCGVAVGAGGRWLLHCGDAFMRTVQIDPLQPARPVVAWLWPFVRPLFPPAAIQKLIALRQAHGEIEMFCAHDPGAMTIE
jgi:glyoxylase-like metal-dependent hydrolase (beta-lactamase superfamily II)